MIKYAIAFGNRGVMQCRSCGNEWELELDCMSITINEKMEIAKCEPVPVCSKCDSRAVTINLNRNSLIGIDRYDEGVAV